jgi:hypothetical protein
MYLWLKGKNGTRPVHIVGADGRTLCQTENCYTADEKFRKAAKRVTKSDSFPVESKRVLCKTCASIQGYKRPVEMTEAEYPF